MNIIFVNLLKNNIIFRNVSELLHIDNCSQCYKVHVCVIVKTLIYIMTYYIYIKIIGHSYIEYYTNKTYAYAISVIRCKILKTYDNIHLYIFENSNAFSNPVKLFCY
jgi:2,3-bisphosphoglycerate-independent phosphoglycerate mutase